MTLAPPSTAAIAAGRPVAPDPTMTTSASRSQAPPGFSVVIVAVIPLVIAVGVGLLRDVGLEAALRQLLLEFLANPWLFVHVGDLLIPQPPIAVVAAQDPWRAERDIASWCAADVEVLVVPLVRRRENGSLLPGDDRLLAL